MNFFLFSVIIDDFQLTASVTLWCGPSQGQAALSGLLVCPIPNWEHVERQLAQLGTFQVTHGVDAEHYTIQAYLPLAVPTTIVAIYQQYQLPADMVGAQSGGQ